MSMIEYEYSSHVSSNNMDHDRSQCDFTMGPLKFRPRIQARSPARLGTKQARHTFLSSFASLASYGILYIIQWDNYDVSI